MSVWKERLPEILRGYDKKNVYNLDETGCFWKALSQQGFAEKGKQCRGGKKNKQCFMIAFMVNAAGKKRSLLLYGRVLIQEVLINASFLLSIMIKKGLG